MSETANYTSTGDRTPCRVRYVEPPEEALTDKEMRALISDATDVKNGGCHYVLLRAHRGELKIERLEKAA